MKTKRIKWAILIILIIDFLIYKNVSEIKLSRILYSRNFVQDEKMCQWFVATALCLILDALILMLFFSKKDYFAIINDVRRNRRMVFQLAKNDFKMRYASSYFGAFWAFVQPVVTILIYVFVFQVGFRAGGTENGYHYVLYLIAGIVPWFFFTEATMGCTNCLTEYSYLVKKVVFKIDVLPCVKVISAMFVHVFFITITIIVFLINGKMPTIYYLQILYYVFCTVCLVLAISYLTAAVTPFFQDFSQIINIILQIGMWTVPIMWKEEMVGRFKWILKLNPMYYIVDGFRDSLIYRVGFWENLELTAYFWVVTIMIYMIGFRVFQKLKVHFADVL